MVAKMMLNFLIIAVSLTVGLIETRQFQRCELAFELLKHNVPRNQLAQWLCITQYESEMKTHAINNYNSDGSRDHGLFQVNDRYWCSPGGANVCKIPCKKLRDDDIKDDVECAKKIYSIHGFSAWVVWNKRCANRELSQFLRGCYI